MILCVNSSLRLCGTEERVLHMDVLVLFRRDKEFLFKSTVEGRVVVESMVTVYPADGPAGGNVHRTALQPFLQYILMHGDTDPILKQMGDMIFGQEEYLSDFR